MQGQNRFVEMSGFWVLFTPGRGEGTGRLGMLQSMDHILFSLAEQILERIEARRSDLTGCSVRGCALPRAHIFSTVSDEGLGACSPSKGVQLDA